MDYSTTSSTRRRGNESIVGEFLCWSRMQAEAGQNVETIVARKECERRAGDGLFFWGVGNAPALAMSELARMEQKVPVIFSMMKTKAKAIDTIPSRTVVWTRYFDLDGVERPLPEHVLVTSRGDSPGGVKTVHYALVCWSRVPLRLEYGTGFDHRAYRNVSPARAPVGPSQVTALLELVGEPSYPAAYEVNLRAWLSASCWVRLASPRELSTEKVAALNQCEDLSTHDWIEFVSDLRCDQGTSVNQQGVELRLF